ncbi:hypothetical protein P873_12745 [Arenimonas composti TR7-09 = DSM 18010]|uniref:Probable periplasmic serine endoprotease DegP-like n=1 Tax=Arenimonas composti TR7-09 = DSM 18010 TaxID=1121013 RepID=A0A091BBZ0_9GAMM|nr:hypothetical protein P873_12745 [Arenimonas composti TR7-09 = DSM 18010]
MLLLAALLTVACDARELDADAARADAEAAAETGGRSDVPPLAIETARPGAPAIVDLPDFTELVERTGPAVVNIEASAGNGAPARNAREEIAPDPFGDDEKGIGRNPNTPRRGVPDQDLPEFFRRFFDEQPGMPVIPRGGVSQGTGFVISPDGYVLTNHHVVNGADTIIVRMSDQRELTATLVGSDPLSDVALLKVDAQNLPVLVIGDSNGLKPGQWVLAIGSPFGFDHSVTAGIVSGVGRRSLDPSQQYVPFIQTDVAINRGNSGGPLLNTAGEVVGINSQIFSNSGGYMGVSFAIPIEVAMNAVRQLRETGQVVRGQLGVRIQDVERGRLEELGLDRPAGAFVDSVENGSAADRAGIRPGDVIVQFEGRDIGRSAELPPLVGAMAPGSKVRVRVIRDGKPRELEVTLTALEVAGGPERAPARQPAADNGRAFGIVVEPLDAAARAALDLKAGEGLLIARVEGAAARRAGLQPGDVVLQVGRHEVGSLKQFADAVAAVADQDEVRLLVRNARSTGFVILPTR